MTSTAGYLGHSTLLSHVREDKILPPGVYPFAPPLVVKKGRLRGSGAETVLQPAGGGTAIVVENGRPEDHDVKTGLPRRVLLSDFRLESFQATQGNGILVDGACIHLERVDVLGFLHGVVIKWAVDVSLTDCLLTRNGCNLYVPGALDSWTTTLRVRGGSIRESVGGLPSILIQAGQGFVFDDLSIESNSGIGIRVEQRKDLPYKVDAIECHRVHFENNPAGHWFDETAKQPLRDAREKDGLSPALRLVRCSAR